MREKSQVWNEGFVGLCYWMDKISLSLHRNKYGEAGFRGMGNILTFKCH